jgi:hypothetical protein
MKMSREKVLGTPVDSILYTKEAPESKRQAAEELEEEDPPKEKAMAVLKGENKNDKPKTT